MLYVFSDNKKMKVKEKGKRNMGLGLKLRTSRCSRGFYKRQRNQRSNHQHPLDHRKSKRIPEKHLFLLL